MGIYAILVAVIMALPSPGVLGQDSWPMYQFKSDNNAVFASPDWKLRWSTTLGGKINGGLSIVGNTIYVESFDRTIYALDARTGEERWDSGIANIAMNTPVVVGNTVFAGTGGNHWFILHRKRAYLGILGGDSVDAIDTQSGRRRWSYRTPGADMPTGILARTGDADEFVFSDGAGHLRALDAETGALLWDTTFPGISSMSSLAAYGDTLIGSSGMTPEVTLAAYASGNPSVIGHLSWTWAARASDGKILWKSAYGMADCSPTIGDGRVFVEGVDAPVTPAQVKAGIFLDPKLSYQAVVVALDARTGTKLWGYRDPDLGPTHPAGSYEFAIAGVYSSGTFYDSLNFSKNFAAFDGRTGRVLWKIPTEGAVKMSAVVKDGKVYVGDNAGYFYVIDARTGMVRAKLHFPEIFTTSPPVIVGKTIFIADTDTVYALPIADIDRGYLPVLKLTQP